MVGSAGDNLAIRINRVFHCSGSWRKKPLCFCHKSFTLFWCATSSLARETNLCFKFFIKQTGGGSHIKNGAHSIWTSSKAGIMFNSGQRVGVCVCVCFKAQIYVLSFLNTFIYCGRLSQVRKLSKLLHLPYFGWVLRT